MFFRKPTAMENQQQPQSLCLPKHVLAFINKIEAELKLTPSGKIEHREWPFFVKTLLENGYKRIDVVQTKERLTFFYFKEETSSMFGGISIDLAKEYAGFSQEQLKTTSPDLGVIRSFTGLPQGRVDARIFLDPSHSS